MLHVALKPNGASWVERKLDEHLYADPWQPFEADVRYAQTTDNSDWRGEVAIPWKAISDGGHKDRPVMLRFNFSQHKTTTGESASWAGPVDFGRDDQFMGLAVFKGAKQSWHGGVWRQLTRQLRSKQKACHESSQITRIFERKKSEGAS